MSNNRPALYAGCVAERIPPPEQLKGLDFVELAPKEPLPKLATVQRWRRALGNSRCALAFPASALDSDLGPLRGQKALEEALDWTLTSAGILDAFALVLSTPPSLTTGQRDRELLEAYVKRVRAHYRGELVWAPSGLWEPAQSDCVAGAMGALYAFDPLSYTAVARPRQYARVLGLGVRQRLGDGDMMQIEQALQRCSAAEAFVAFYARNAVQNATRFKRLVS